MLLFIWPQMIKLKLPKYTYSMRDTKSGFLFLGYSDEYNELYSTILAEEYIKHLTSFGINAKEITIQTDNGSEFGARKRNINTPGFVNTIEQQLGAKHNYIPIGMCNANADVESVHATIEKEFFDLEQYDSKQDFFIKLQAYQYFYNLVRPNFSKKGKTPLQILEEDRPQY